jgi:hypothetical protein
LLMINGASRLLSESFRRSTRISRKRASFGKRIMRFASLGIMPRTARFD